MRLSRREAWAFPVAAACIKDGAFVASSLKPEQVAQMLSAVF